MNARMSLAIVLTLLVICVATANAQAKGMSFGLKGGVNYANMSFDIEAYPNTDNSLRYGAGITLGTLMQPNMGFDIDLLYLQKGTEFHYPGFGDLFYEFTLDYVVVSPMLRIAPGAGGAGIYFLGGPEIAYLLEATNHGEREGSQTDWDVTESFKEFDYGLTFGMGFQTAGAGRSSFFVEGRYALGLADIGKSQATASDGADTGEGIKTRGIYLFGGLRF